MNKIRIFGVLLFSTCFFNALAQEKDNFSVSNSESFTAGDPIIEMLDSLVAANYTSRYNANAASSFQQQKYDFLNEIPEFNDQEYASRINSIQTPIPLTYNEEVKKYIDVYAFRKRELTRRVLGLSGLYFPMFEEALDKEGLPDEFKYLAIVESALNPVAVSRAGATGIWQFMFNTGKLYNLKINSFIDERRDPLKATYAACRYFKEMYEIYRDWLLVIAAYNCGPGNVNRAIVRSGGKTNFWEISRFLPAETRGYVPAFMAVCYVMNFANEHKLVPVPPDFSYFEVDTVMIDRQTTLSKIAQGIDVPSEVIRYLNPVYKKGIVPAVYGERQVVRLPVNKINDFVNAMEMISRPDPVAPAPVLATLKLPDDLDEYDYISEKVTRNHTVKKGESIQSIARKYKCSVTEIKKANRLHSTVLRSGQKLKIQTWVTSKVKKPEPVEESPAASETGLNPAMPTDSENVETAASSASPLTAGESEITEVSQEKNAGVNQKVIYHLVQKGDTLWSISKKYSGASIEQIMELNKLTNTTDLKTGTKIKIPVSG